LSISELAQVTGAPLGTAKGRVRLGLARARALLESPV
jgi:DNA-directed RNA polymerase specialized sigma24 family protein